MKRHDNHKEHELQRRIEEQEQAMGALLLRVMERPLMPLHQTIGELRSQITVSQQATVKATQLVEVSVTGLLEAHGKRSKKDLGEVAGGIRGLQDGLSGLSSTLATQHAEQVERDEGLRNKLTSADNALTQLEARAQAADEVLADTARTLNKIDGTLDAVCDQQRTAANLLSQELGSIREQHQSASNRISEEFSGLGQRLDQQHAHLDEDHGKTTASLEQLHGKAVSTGDALAMALQAIAAVNAGIAALRDREHTARSELSSELAVLAQQIGQQQAGLSKHIEGVQHHLTPRLDQLAASISTSSSDVTRQYESLSRNQEALVTAAVQEQLARQLTPFQVRTKWLTVLCGLSFASTLALLAVQLLK